MSAKIRLRVERLDHGRDLPLPRYETPGSAGMDLRAAVGAPVVIAPGERALIPTGLRLAIPQGYEGQVRARSGLASRRGIGLPNAPGTIDSDYRGEVKVALINWSSEPFTIERGARIAQLVLAPVVQAAWERVDDLERTERDAGGFGHTGGC